ncbi:MAG: hypothetical protein ACE5IG_06265 [Dehalococcoidia bacterium]
MTLPLEPLRVGEVVETSTTGFTAQCYRLDEAPPLGALVRTGSEAVIYGVVAHIATTSLDPGRRPIALGQEEESEEAVYRSNPQLARLLRTQFQAITVGHGNADALSHHLPSLPPRIHHFVYQCAADEVARFTTRLDFLRLLLDAPASAGDEVVRACLRQASAAHPDASAFLVAAGKELAGLLSNDVLRLNTLLRGLADERRS